jgi:CRISPR-associated protein Csm1
MDDKQYNSVILAALLHDIGKFEQRKDTKSFSAKKHLEYSSDFAKDKRFEKQIKEWVNVDLVITLIEHHHNPDIREAIGEDKLNDLEQALSWLVSDADSYSASERHYGFYERVETHICKRPLDSIFTQITLLPEPWKRETYRYDLKELSAFGAFPRSRDIKTIYADDEVSRHLQNFKEEIYNIKADAFSHFYISLLSLLERFLWGFPSAVAGPKGTVGILNDVSLYDHLKTSSAIAACLYQYHENDITGYIPRVARGEETDKVNELRLVGGEISGIQNYLYKISNIGEGGVAKRLRSRSFYITALTEMITVYILDTFDLPISCNLFSTGGKFLLLLPNLERVDETMQQIEKTLQQWLLEQTNGELRITLDWQQGEMEGERWRIHRFHEVADRVYDGLATKEMQALQAVMMHRGGWDADSFVRKVDFAGSSACSVCESFAAKFSERDFNRSLPVTPENNVPKFCEHCASDKRIGESLVDARYLAFGQKRKPVTRNTIYFFSNYFVQAMRTLMASKLDGAVRFVQEIHSGAPPQKKMALGVGRRYRFLANYVPKLNSLATEDQRRIDEFNQRFPDEKVQGDEILTFRHLAWLCRWTDENGVTRGTELLGVLRADIDNLGYLFSSGLKRLDERTGEQVDDVTISRYLTFSRMVDTFFSGWVGVTLSKHSKLRAIYTVYSGGDDLFLVGPWDRIILFAIYLNRRFRRFTCSNTRNITLSAGIAIVKPHHPISAAADEAKRLLDTAKERGKDRLAIFDTDVKWDELQKLLDFATWLHKKLHDEDSNVTFGFVYRLLRYHQMFIRFKKGGWDTDLRYVPMAKYDLSRNIIKADKSGRVKSGEEEAKKLNKVLDDNAMMAKLKIPLFWVLYSNRRAD